MAIADHGLRYAIMKAAQHPLQMLLILRSMALSSFSVRALPVPLLARRPVPTVPPEGAAVPSELVRGAAALVPSAPPGGGRGEPAVPPAPLPLDCANATPATTICKVTHAANSFMAIS